MNNNHDPNKPFPGFSIFASNGDDIPVAGDLYDALDSFAHVAVGRKLLACEEQGQFVDVTPIVMFVVQFNDGDAIAVGEPDFDAIKKDTGIDLSDTERWEDALPVIVNWATKSFDTMLDDFIAFTESESDGEIDEIVRQMDRIRIRRMVKYVAIAADSYVRAFTDETLHQGMALRPGELRDEFRKNPFSEISEAMTIMAFGPDGQEIHGVVELKRNDAGMPEVGDAHIAKGTIGEHSEKTAKLLRSYMATLTPKSE